MPHAGKCYISIFISNNYVVVFIYNVFFFTCYKSRFKLHCNFYNVNVEGKRNFRNAKKKNPITNVMRTIMVLANYYYEQNIGICA